MLSLTLSGLRTRWVTFLGAFIALTPAVTLLVVMGQAPRTPWKEGTNAATSALIYRILYTDRTDSRPLSGRLVDDNCSRIKSNKGSLWIVASQPVDRPLPVHQLTRSRQKE